VITEPYVMADKTKQNKFSTRAPTNEMIMMDSLEVKEGNVNPQL